MRKVPLFHSIEPVLLSRIISIPAQEVLRTGPTQRNLLRKSIPAHFQNQRYIRIDI
jgi:hypothetical protein